MKLYIAVDTEGEACITRESSDTAAYGTFQAEYLRTVATREATAAVEGGPMTSSCTTAGFIRGVTPIGMVLRYDELPRGIRIALGRAFMKDVAAEGFDAAFLIGHHAMADTPGGVMAHTFSPVTIKGMALNGTPIGEIGIEALQLGTLGIPVTLVTADEAGCREARDLLGDVERAAVKRGLGLHAAVSLHPDDACDLIRRKARRAIERQGEIAPFRMDGPFELHIVLHGRPGAHVGAEARRRTGGSGRLRGTGRFAARPLVARDSSPGLRLNEDVQLLQVGDLRAGAAGGVAPPGAGDGEGRDDRGDDRTHHPDLPVSAAVLRQGTADRGTERVAERRRREHHCPRGVVRVPLARQRRLRPRLMNVHEAGV